MNENNEMRNNEAEFNEAARYLNPLFSFFNDYADEASMGLMRADVIDENDKYVIEVEIPGVDKKDINLNLEHNHLTVTASLNKNTDRKYLRSERRNGSYKRSFYVGENVLKSDISASFNNGLLTITVLKATERKATESNIEII